MRSIAATKLLVGAAAGLLCAGRVVAQGDTGFLRGKDKLDLAITYGLDTYDEFWIGDTKIKSPPFGRVTRQTANVYAAYGVTDDLDLTANGSYVWVDTDAIFSDVDALQDLVLQAKWRFKRCRIGNGDLNLLAAPAVKLPMTHYEDNSVNAVGDGQVDLRARGIVQYRCDNSIFVALETGYDFRFDAPDDEVPIHLTVGGNIGPKVTVTGFYSKINSLGGYNIGAGPFPGVEEEYDRVGGGAYVRLTDRFGLTANVWTTLDGKNTGDVDGFSIGAVFNF